ncbi:hypothetical protein [Treponema primitia]|uniref:hypothetical protein n=1 Tax=Treponema primitia TaxID=88058 RepID=UPI0002555493|nr:hypothetical protein [Treponema primitia]
MFFDRLADPVPASRRCVQESPAVFKGLVPSFFVFLILASCASGPKTPVQTPGSPGQEFAALAPGGLAYFYTDVNRARPILNHIVLKDVDMKQTARILQKVDFLAGAVYPNGSSRNMILHAWRQKGKIPGGAGLVFSPQWKGTLSPTGKKYWHSSRAGLSVSLQGPHAFVSDGDPFTDGPPISLPENLNEIRWEAIVLGWLEHAGTPINNFLSKTGMPIRIPTERILFAIAQSSGQDLDDDDAEAINSADSSVLYELQLRVETQNPNQARALAALLSFVRVLTESPDLNVDAEFLEVLRPLLVNPPSQEEADLVIHTRPMSAEGIALLFNRFAVYSQ